MLADIFGMDGIIVVIVVLAVLFGSSQIPKIARSLGSAQSEFKKGIDEGKSSGTESSGTESSGSGSSGTGAEKDPKNS